MADPTQPCTCVPYQNLCCCGPQKGISVVQPACQNLPDGSVVNNPAFSSALGKSFWTYKFLTDCDKNTSAISNFGIPICEVIRDTHLVVSEKIDGCGQFVPVPFTLAKTDPNFGTAPTGFQWLKIENNNRYEKGVSVEYLLELSGNFPTSIQPIKVKAGTNVSTFDCGCFLVPQCNPQGKLAIEKICGNTIVNNQATLHYDLHVDNIGSAPLTNVQFLDTIFIPTQLTFGTITVNPPTLTVDTGTPSQVKISGNLGTIDPGGHIPITYTIPISGISGPGQYIINNTAKVVAIDTEASTTCSTNLEVVQLSTVKCCDVLGRNKGSFKLTISTVGNSPGILVDIVDSLHIPVGLTVQFNDFGGCTAKFAGSGTPVPINSNVAGPVDIDITCSSLSVPQGGSAQKTLIMTVISSSVFGAARINNGIDNVTPTSPNAQVFLGAGSLPVEAEIEVVLNASCKNPCS